MIPLLLADPLSDDRGLEYVYPRAALYAESGFADLTGFEALEREGRLVLRVRLARYPNPQQAPNGFSLATVAVYLDMVPGGRTDLEGSGFATPPQDGWEQMLLLTGWDAQLRQSDGQSTPVQASLVDDWLEVATPIPAGDYGYYVASGLYDPFAPGYFRALRPEAGEWNLSGPPGFPAAVDVLSQNQAESYTTGVLLPVTAPKSTQPVMAWVLGGLGLLSWVAALVWPRSRRRRRQKP